jgi:hypothetical protein
MSEEIASPSSVSALKARFSGKQSNPSTPLNNNNNGQDDTNKSESIKKEITTQRRLSVKDMANRFKDPSTITEEQRNDSKKSNSSSKNLVNEVIFFIIFFSFFLSFLSHHN